MIKSQKRMIVIRNLHDNNNNDSNCNKIKTIVRARYYTELHDHHGGGRGAAHGRTDTLNRQSDFIRDIYGFHD